MKRTGTPLLAVILVSGLHMELWWYLIIGALWVFDDLL